MAKVKVTDTAKELQTRAEELLERFKKTQAEVSECLQSVKRAEARLGEKEEEERKVRIEQERAERLRELLAREDDLAFHVGEHEETEEAEQTKTPEPVRETAPVQENVTVPAAEAQPIEKKTEKAVKQPETAAASEVKPAQSAETASKPETAAQPAAAGKQSYDPRGEQRRFDNNGNTAPRTDRPERSQNAPRSNTTYNQNAPRSNTPYNSNAPRGNAPYNSNAPRGNTPYNSNAPRGNAPYNSNAPRGNAPYNSNAPRGNAPYNSNAPRGNAPYNGGAPRTGGAPASTAARPPQDGYKASPQARTVGNPKDKRRGDDSQRGKNKKTLMRETAPTGYEDEGFRRRNRRKQQEIHKIEPIVIEKAVITTENITVKELSEKIGKPAAEIIKKLFMLGIMATINQEIDFDTCALVAADYDIELEKQLTKTYEDVLAETSEEADDEENLIARPPVVTIMGHVDHGKTSLLDAIRKSSITEGEAGGITQHIGAYTVMCNGRQITFIDTPGHEAFTSMRARGAQVTDIVILVVAADDGIMPQTIEAINHSKAAGVPIIVAINKMDKESANPERVKQQLTEQGLVCEEWGGETICVPVSAKSKMNLDSLLEMVLLQADVLELKANPQRMAKGTIVEAELDKGRGPIATVLVQNGTLKVGDPIVAGTTYGRVRAMMDDKGKRVTEAGPSMPVSVLGFSEVPSAGDVMNVAEIDKLSRQVAEERRDKQKAEQLKSISKVSLDDLFNQIAEGEIKTLNLIVKADVQGSVEAVKQALEKLSNDEVHVKCIHGGVGAITGTDVMFASASEAIIIGFNVRPDSSARELAQKEKVDMRMYRVIYDAIEEVQNAMKGMFAPVFKENVLGHVKVRDTFKVSGVGTIAGCYVQEGKIVRNAQVRVVRDGVVIHEGKISSLKRFKDDVKEVATGYECGVGIDGFNDIHENDEIEAFVMEEVER